MLTFMRPAFAVNDPVGYWKLGNADNWSGASYFAGDKEYWGGRAASSDGTGDNSLWPTTNKWAVSCGTSGSSMPTTAWDTSSGTSHIGQTNNTASNRWANPTGLSCATVRHLVCMVHP